MPDSIHWQTQKNHYAKYILAIKENKIIKYGRRKYKRWIAEVKYGVTSLHLYCKDIFVPLRRTLRIQYLMWLYKCTSCPCIRAGFAFIAPEPISSATVIQKLQNSYTYSDTKIPTKHEKIVGKTWYISQREKVGNFWRSHTVNRWNVHFFMSHR